MHRILLTQFSETLHRHVTPLLPMTNPVLLGKIGTRQAGGL